MESEEHLKQPITQQTQDLDEEQITVTYKQQSIIDKLIDKLSKIDLQWYFEKVNKIDMDYPNLIYVLVFIFILIVAEYSSWSVGIEKNGIAKMKKYQNLKLNLTQEFQLLLNKNESSIKEEILPSDTFQTLTTQKYKQDLTDYQLTPLEPYQRQKKNQQQQKLEEIKQENNSQLIPQELNIEQGKQQKQQEQLKQIKQEKQPSIEIQTQFSQSHAIQIQKNEIAYLAELNKTYSQNQKEIQKVQENIFNNISIAIHEDKQINKKKSYSSFEQKLEQTSTRKQQLFNLKLFPYLQDWATSTKKVRKAGLIKKISNTFTGFFKNQDDQWEQLYTMMKNQELWQSQGHLLTVGTYGQHSRDKYSTLQLFVPAIVTIQVPYDTLQNETIKIYGFRMRFDLYRKIETPIFSQYLGQIKINVTDKEYQMREPVKRTFYCEQMICNRISQQIENKFNKNSNCIYNKQMKRKNS